LEKFLKNPTKEECTSMAREISTLIKKQSELSIQISKLAENGNYDMVEQLKQQKQQLEERFNQISGAFVLKCYNYKSDEIKKAKELLIRIRGTSTVPTV